MSTNPHQRVMMAFCDAHGQIYEHPELEMLGWDGECWRPISAAEVTPIPKGSDLFTLPGRRPAGYDAQRDEVLVLDEAGVEAVSCFLAPAYLRTVLPAFESIQDAPTLPIFAYSAVGFLDGEFVAPSVRVDPDIRQDPYRFDLTAIEASVTERLEGSPDNRLLGHLRRCALEYHCRAAQNFFLDRFEAPLPAAPTCNAFCVGCISLQDHNADEAFPASHDRINFKPTPDELAEVALGHIARVGGEAVVSFGQGCEGEPLNAPIGLEGCIRQIRAKTQDGVINLNTNGSRHAVVRRLCEAGLDSIRISTNSAQAGPYAAYYRPTGYTLDDVQETARVVKEHQGLVMLNYFIFPGFTDTQPEFEALCDWIDEGGIDMLQLRNLNMDPELYLSVVGAPDSPPMGIDTWLRALQGRFPSLMIGYFNPPKSRFEKRQETIEMHWLEEEARRADL